MAKAFFDTNILLYLLSAEAAKADRAEELLAAGGVVSVQVLNEFASVSTRKLGADWSVVREVLASLRQVLAVEPLTIETHERGLDLADRHRLNLYDGMILAAASVAGCDVLYSEDMHAGLAPAGGPLIRNPFVA